MAKTTDELVDIAIAHAVAQVVANMMCREFPETEADILDRSQKVAGAVKATLPLVLDINAFYP